MKKLLKILVVVSFLTAIPYLTNGQTQSPGAKDGEIQQNDDGPGGGDPPGGGAPIGGGLFILLGLGAAYGGKKLYNLNK